MPRPAPPRRTPQPRRRILWMRAVPVFVGMMVALFLAQYFLLPRFPNTPLTANGGLGLSLIAGIVGAFLISRFATVTPPPPPSKSQQRKMAAGDRTRPEAGDDGEEPVAVGARPSGQRRRRRRR
jgi:hypothetical protein